MPRLFCRTSGGSFRRDERGSITVEFVLWVPLLVAFLLFATDVTLAFMRQSHVWQVSRETARIVSRYGMDEVQAEAFARESGTMGTNVPDVDVRFDGTDVIVTMSLPTASLTPFNTLGFVLGDRITSRVHHSMEPL
jgi:Flp pilus assembly protein TadG